MSMADGHLPFGRRKRAFTLVEGIVVIVIVGVLATISLPRFAGFYSHRRIQLVARKIAADLAYAQHLARLKGTTQSVSFKVEANTYELIGVQDPDRPGQRYQVTLSDEPYVAKMTSADFSGEAVVAFDLYGVPNSGGTIVVGRGSHGLILTIDAETGEVTVIELEIATPMPL